MLEQYDILDTNVRKQTHAEFNVTLHTFADSLESHPFFKDNWEPYVPGSSHFRDHATRLKELGIGADRGDCVLKAERDAARGLAELHIDIAVKYMVVRAVDKNDPTILHGAGLPLKSKPQKSSSRSVSSAPVPITLTAKHQKGKSGSVIIEGKHVRKGGPYLLQICKGEPVSEEYWYSPGGDYKNCGKIVLSNLEPANRYYFRMRTDGPEGPGPWSQAVSLIIL